MAESEKKIHRVPQSKDDAVLLKHRADMFRKDYRAWRKGAPKGAKNEITDLVGGDEDEITSGAAGYQAGYRDWRKGGHKGAKDRIGTDAAISVSSSAQTRHIGATDRLALDEAKHEDEEQGQRWTPFFLHPQSTFEHHTPLQVEDRRPSLENILNPPKLEPLEFALSMETLPLIEKAHSSRELGARTQIPKYERNLDSVDCYQCHIGVGGFHRSHQAFIMDEILRSNFEGPRWAIVGIALLHFDQKLYLSLKSQDFLYTLMNRDSDGSVSRVIGSIFDLLYAPDERQHVIETLSHPKTKIVSLTITEKGYCMDTTGKHLNLQNPMIRNDLEHPDEPTSAPGYIAAALRNRKTKGLPGFSVMSCDNLEGNGHIAQVMVIEFLDALHDEELKEWCLANVSFPNTMVDRITPVPSEEHRMLVKEVCQIEDQCPVVAEAFFQWVIEDNFVQGRPAWDQAGALIVPDVTPYEQMKLRLLNAGHSALSFPAFLGGKIFVDNAMYDKKVSHYVLAYLDEVTQTVSAVPGVDIEVYKQTLIQRFSNPYIKDTLQRLAEDGSQKLVTTMKDAALENLKADRPIELFCFVVASFIRYITGIDALGKDFDIKDSLASSLQPLARDILGMSDENRIAVAPEEPPVEFIRCVFGNEVAVVPAISSGVHHMLLLICSRPMMDLITELPQH